MTTSPAQIDFEEAFDEYWKLIYSICLKYLHNESNAEDMMQDVFIAAMKNQHKYDPTRGSVKVWLMQYAYFMCIGRIRGWYRKGAEVKLKELERNLPYPVSWKSSSIDPCSVIDAIEKQRVIDSLLWSDNLSPWQRRIIQLRLKDKDFSEISAEMGGTEKSVEAYYCRAILALRATFYQGAPEPPAVSGECLWCKTPIEVKTWDKRLRRKIFCSQKCGNKYRYHRAFSPVPAPI